MGWKGRVEEAGMGWKGRVEEEKAERSWKLVGVGAGGVE